MGYHRQIQVSPFCFVKIMYVFWGFHIFIQVPECITSVLSSLITKWSTAKPLRIEVLQMPCTLSWSHYCSWTILLRNLRNLNRTLKRHQNWFHSRADCLHWGATTYVTGEGKPALWNQIMQWVHCLVQESPASSLLDSAVAVGQDG